MAHWQTSPVKRARKMRDRKPTAKATFGQQAADAITTVIGSWRFVIWQNIIVICWIVLNIVGIFGFRWDAAPFILLNLIFSWQASNTGPILQLSSNRQSEIDRQHVAHIETLTEQATALERRLDALVEGMATLLEADHVEHGRLLRELHAHTRCDGHTVIIGPGEEAAA